MKLLAVGDSSLLTPNPVLILSVQTANQSESTSCTWFGTGISRARPFLAGYLLGLLLLVVPAVGHAEVMDKEPAVSAVWLWAVLGGASGASAWAVRWWLGLPISVVVGLLFASVWGELTDPFVGPAIRAEAGMGYVWNVMGATATTLALHVLGALVGRRHRRLLTRKHPAA